MPKYTVKSPLNHDNKDYAIGDKVEMSEKQAEPLFGHTLARPGESLTEKQVAQGVSAVEAEATRLVEQREQLVDWEQKLTAAQEKLTRDQAELEAGRQQLAADQAALETDRQQLAADRADFEKAAKAGKK